MIIQTDTTISDVCSENITVAENVVLTIKGICSQMVLASPHSKVIVIGICNELEVSKNSFAEINGTVHHLLNNGNIVISGTVTNLEDLSSNAIIKSGAFVNGKSIN